MHDLSHQNTPEAAEARRERLANLAAQHRGHDEGRDHDQGNGQCGFYDSADTYRAERAGQRGKF